EKYNIGLSPATIRNVFRDLEELGYINSRHHSGGRVPTESGFRFYIDSLVSLYELTILEKQRIQEEYLKYQFKLDQILNATSRVLSRLSQKASVVLAPKKNQDTLKHVELIHVSGEEILAIVVTRSGAVINKNIFANQNISQESLYKISRFLNETVKGFEIDYIFNEFMDELKQKQEREIPSEIYPLIDNMKHAFGSELNFETELYIGGLKNLYDNFKDDDISHMESVLALLDNKSLLKQIFSQYIESDDVSAFVGGQEDLELNGVSIIATSYKMGDKRIGSMGIIGPRRMNYNRALALVDYTSMMVSEMVTRISR
ncbi:MAG: heat-inducible transcription repressor HrcA, partial [Leptospiraceae bacterium]|nr:heat-inducible transcription repressor HrcA [Leptospiraceae bacterium]